MEFLITEEAIVGRSKQSSSQAVTGHRFGCYFMSIRQIRRHRHRQVGSHGRTEVRRDVSQKLRQIANCKIAKLQNKSNHTSLTNNKSKKVIAMTMREDALLPLAVLVVAYANIR